MLIFLTNSRIQGTFMRDRLIKHPADSLREVDDPLPDIVEILDSKVNSGDIMYYVRTRGKQFEFQLASILKKSRTNS